MKTVGIVVLLFVSCLSFSQALISPALSGALTENKQEYISVNIFFNSFHSISDLGHFLDLKKADFDERVKAVNNLLSMNAEISQNEFAPFIEKILSEDKMAISKISYYRSVNMLNILIKPDYIYSMSEQRCVRYIDINSPRYKLVAPQEAIEPAIKTVNGTEPGLKAVNAHKLWEMGYSGRNILFLSMDTGVFPSHPAIADNFAGNHFPLSQCWYGVRSEEPADHATSSHGTHTTGTVLGLDQTTNDTIGVAFNSMWIASDPVASTDADILDPADFMNVFEWVLDPDGNPETTDDVPRVINNSWGYDYSLALQFGACEMPEAEIFVTLEVAGICSPFSAGNDGPGSSTNGFPAMRAFNVVNPMSIGAVNGSNVIASFSSRGPTPCISEEGQLQIKPEVVAPGVNVRSCTGVNSYSFLQGTSMACPHVSGVLLLLAEAFPMASAYELKYAIYETAIDLGEVGEDNIYGRGMVDALAAFNYLSNTYTPVPPVTNQYDLKSEMISPSDEFLCPDESVVSVMLDIINGGETTINGFVVEVFLNDVLICDSLFESSLNPDAVLSFNLSNVQLLQGENFIHSRVSTIEDITEFNRFNNAINQKVVVLGETQFPYLQNFELLSEDFSDSELMIINPDFKNTWTNLSWGDSDQYKAIGVNFNKYGTRLWEEDFVYFPQIQIPDDDSLFFIFTYAYKNRLVNYYNDSLIVEASTDCGMSFSDTLFAQGGLSLASVEGDAMSTEYKPISTADFDTVLLNMNAMRGQNVVFRLKSKNDRGSVLYIDEVKIAYLSQNSDVHDVLFVKLPEVYPNPASDNLVIEFFGVLDELEIFDISGRKISVTNVKTGKNDIDISRLKDGLYFMNFKNSSYSKKLIVSRIKSE